jgi:translation initiation factor 2B subunit (eIF-2B alpha/beta/delta family)
MRGQVQQDTHWRDLVRGIATDKLSGASELAKKCATLLVTYSEQEHPLSVESVRTSVAQTAAYILEAQGSMAPVVRIFNDVLLALNDATAVRAAIDELRRIAHESIALVQHASQLVSEGTLKILPSSGTILTISYSAAVARALSMANRYGYQLRVICLESRPKFEGRKLAAFLSKRGVSVELKIDAAAYDALRTSDLVLVGADSLTDTGVINKIGTTGIAVCAAYVGVNSFVVADRSKIWPAKIGDAPLPKHDQTEIWERVPRGVVIDNRYFELTPWELFAGAITERGETTASEIAEESRSLEVSEAIKAIVDTLR